MGDRPPTVVRNGRVDSDAALKGADHGRDTGPGTHVKREQAIAFAISA